MIRKTLRVYIKTESGTVISDSLDIDINCRCYNQNLYLSWLNYLGGFDYWNFTAEKEHQVEVLDSQSIEENIFPQWPNSYGEFASTIEKQTYRTTKNSLLVRSQHLTEAQVVALKCIRTSPVVQIVNSQYDRRTVIVDKDSFKVYNEGEKLHEISFKVFYTDEIPSQSI